MCRYLARHRAQILKSSPRCDFSSGHVLGHWLLRMYIRHRAPRNAGDVWTRPLPLSHSLSKYQRYPPSLGPRYLHILLNSTIFYSPILYSTIGTTLSGAPDNYKGMFRKKPMSYILFNLTTAVDGMAGEVHYGNKHEVQDSFTWILGLFHWNTLRRSLWQHTSGPGLTHSQNSAL